MQSQDPTTIATSFVTSAGIALFGPNWIAPFAAKLNVNEQTVRRIEAAAREGIGYPAALNLIDPIDQLLKVEINVLSKTAKLINDARPAMGLAPSRYKLCNHLSSEG